MGGTYSLCLKDVTSPRVSVDADRRESERGWEFCPSVRLKKPKNNSQNISLMAAIWHNKYCETCLLRVTAMADVKQKFLFKNKDVSTVNSSDGTSRSLEKAGRPNRQKEKVSYSNFFFILFIAHLTLFTSFWNLKCVTYKKKKKDLLKLQKPH